MEKSYSFKHGDTEETVSSLGGTVARLTVGGEDIFYPWRMVGDKARGGCPICAPWFGSSPRGEKKHGFMRDMEADSVDVEEDVPEFVFFQKGRENYPWEMKYSTSSYVHSGGIFKMSLRIGRLNDGIASRAPVLPGFHPYFACDDASKVEVYSGGEKFQGFSNEARVLPLFDKRIIIKVPGKRTINIQLEKYFFCCGQPQMVFWTDSPGEYFCVEPILYSPKIFDTEAGLHLAEGQIVQITMSIKVEQ